MGGGRRESWEEGELDGGEREDWTAEMLADEQAGQVVNGSAGGELERRDPQGGADEGEGERERFSDKLV
jgi:hypothetical protein